MNTKFFPDIIRDLPEADIPIDGLSSYIFQGKNSQIIFMEFDKDTEVSEHSHEAQWGAVLSGEIELTIGGKIHKLKKGDTYFIPAGIAHGAKIKTGYKDISLFNQKDRYAEK